MPVSPRCSLYLPCRDFGTEFLTCDCHLRWLLPWARNHSLQLSERTLCAYPSALHAQALSSLQEAQLRCGEKPVPGPKEWVPHPQLAKSRLSGPHVWIYDVHVFQDVLFPPFAWGGLPPACLNLF